MTSVRARSLAASPPVTSHRRVPWAQCSSIPEASVRDLTASKPERRYLVFVDRNKRYIVTINRGETCRLHTLSVIPRIPSCVRWAYRAEQHEQKQMEHIDTPLRYAVLSDC